MLWCICSLRFNAPHLVKHPVCFHRSSCRHAYIFFTDHNKSGGWTCSSAESQRLINSLYKDNTIITDRKLLLCFEGRLHPLRSMHGKHIIFLCRGNFYFFYLQLYPVCNK
uniref:Uncharacterized protein n=1 Tax=Arundo donax TaxID=35708 RepID=A0A0A8YY54_ARUDO